MNEADVKKTCTEYLDYLENLGKLIYIRNNSFIGAITRPNGSKGFIRNGKPGSPDMFIFCQDKRTGDAKTLHIEFKAPKVGKLSPEQVKWRDVVVQWGHDWYKIQDVEELKFVLNKYV